MGCATTLLFYGDTIGDPTLLVLPRRLATLWAARSRKPSSFRIHIMAHLIRSRAKYLQPSSAVHEMRAEDLPRLQNCVGCG